MKLYYAGMMGATKDLRAFFLEAIPNPRILCSFAYPEHITKFAKDCYPDQIDDCFLDSGAWTAFNKGRPVDIDEYGRFVEESGHMFTHISTLDDIADWEGTKRNWLYLREQYPTYEFLPVYHIGEPLEALEFYLGHSPSKISLGGVAGEMFTGRPSVEASFEYIFKVHPYKYHVFGVNTIPLLMHLPFDSCDAMTWRSGSRFGEIVTPWGRFKVGRSGAATRHTHREDVRNWLRDSYQVDLDDPEFHYSAIDKVNMRVLYDLLETEHKGLDQGSGLSWTGQLF